jgi:hypothetical protein
MGRTTFMAAAGSQARRRGRSPCADSREEAGAKAGLYGVCACVVERGREEAEWDCRIDVCECVCHQCFFVND